MFPANAQQSLFRASGMDAIVLIRQKRTLTQVKTGFSHRNMVISCHNFV